MAFETIRAEQMEGNVFQRIGEQWMLITAGRKESFNTMTASWGGLGVLWNRPVATVYVRPSRYTYGFMEQSAFFTLSFLPKAYRNQLTMLGKKSGREMDKMNGSGLTPAFRGYGQVYFAEAELVLICKKLYYQDLEPDHFLDPKIETNYNGNDYHSMYIGEITEMLVRKN